MSVSYNRLWKQLIDKNMKRIEMQHLTKKKLKKDNTPDTAQIS